jgi:hypothetical protein
MSTRARFLRLRTAFSAVVLTLLVLPGVVHAESVTLQQLLDSQLAVVVGDKVFFNFQEYGSLGFDGAIPVPADMINVRGNPLGVGGPELVITSDKFRAGPGQLQSTIFTYEVSTLSGAALMFDEELFLTSFEVHTFGDFVTVFNRTSVGTLTVAGFGTGQDHLSDRITFSPTNHITVNTEIRVNGNAAVNTFRAGVSQTPEPATLLLLGSGLMGMGIAGRRRRKRKTPSSG